MDFSVDLDSRMDFSEQVDFDKDCSAADFEMDCNQKEADRCSVAADSDIDSAAVADCTGSNNSVCMDSVRDY